MSWISACRLDDIEQEGVIRFDHGGRTYAVYRSPEDEVFCTDGLCSHEAIHLADGLVMDYEIECPKHSGAFDYRAACPRDTKTGVLSVSQPPPFFSLHRPFLRGKRLVLGEACAGQY